MAGRGKLQAEVEIKSDPEQFFHCWGGKAHLLPDMCPQKLHSVDVHEGDWQTKGSVKLWTFVLPDGKVETFKERFTVDEENKIITFDGIEGDPMTHYKKYNAALQIVTKDQSSWAKWSIDYEKADDNAPIPTHYLDWLVNAGKHSDEALLKA